MSPAYLYLGPVTLKKGETFDLAYRILHLRGEIEREQLQKRYDEYAGSIAKQSP
jgi:hypothetical protein